MNIVLSTRNPSKAEQIKAVFEGSGISIMMLDDVGIEGQAVEDGTTLKENALKKALFVHQANASVWAMSDDTGIFIDAIGGAPGVDTAYWVGNNHDTSKATQWILEQLKGVKDRSATFRTTVAIVSPKGEQYFFTGEVKGKILEVPIGNPQPHMPYSTIFVPDDTNKVWSEMTVDEENAVSHRGKAFRRAKQFLESL